METMPAPSCHAVAGEEREPSVKEGRGSSSPFQYGDPAFRRPAGFFRVLASAIVLATASVPGTQLSPGLGAAELAGAARAGPLGAPSRMTLADAPGGLQEAVRATLDREIRRADNWNAPEGSMELG